jgi:hypothetical protein
METLRQHILPGKVYRRSDLDYFSTAVDRHLKELSSDGTLQKISHGLYYAPKKSKFGNVPPEDSDLVKCFLNDENFLLLSPNSYNSLGLGLTQLYNVTWVYNHKRRGEFILNGKTFLFKMKSGYPRELTPEFLVVDLLNNLDELSEDQEKVVNSFQKNLNQFSLPDLVKMAKQYGSRFTKSLMKKALRKSNSQHA